MNYPNGMIPASAYPRLAATAMPELVVDPVTSISIGEILRIVRRNLLWIGLATVVAVIGTAIVLRYVPSTFRASAVLQVAQPLPPIPTDFPANQENVIDDMAVNSETDAVLSVPVLNDVIARLQLDNDPEFNPVLAASMPSKLWGPLALVVDFVSDLPDRIGSLLSPSSEAPADIEHRLVQKNLQRALSVYVKNRSRTIVVEALSESPEKAATIANAVATAFLQNRLDAKLAYANQLSGWLNNRLAELRGKMGQSEQDVQHMRTVLGQYKGMNATLLSEQLSQLNRQLIDAQAEQSIAQSKYDQIKRLGKPGEDIGAANNVLASPLIRSLREQKAQLITQRGEELSRLGPRHPDIISVNAQIKQIDGAINAETSRISKNAADELNVVNARVAALEEAKHTLEQHIDTQNAGLVNVEQLQRDADTDRKTYEAFAVYRDKIAGLSTIQPEAELLSRATAPLVAVYPRHLLTLSIVALVTLLLGAVLALMRESLDQRFHSAQDVAAILGLGTLALVPRLAGHLRPENYVTGAPRSAVAESIRYLYAELDRTQPDKTPYKVLISSSLQGEGKTTTSTMLAREAATNGRKTLLINLDIRHPSASMGRDSREPCQMQTLVQAGRLFEPTLTVESSTGLTRLSFRTMLYEPFKLLYTSQFWRELAAITADYELVIIDSPPILLVPDAKIIATFAHKTVFLIKWGSTKRQTASEGLRHFRTTGAEICGAVLTQVDPRKYAQYEDNYVRGYLGSSNAYYGAN